MKISVNKVVQNKQKNVSLAPLEKKTKLPHLMGFPNRKREEKMDE
jgi:hypothetical protein